MRALERKLLRDLWQMRGSAVAIGLVLAAGVATFMMFLTTLDSLRVSLDSFYRSYRFGHVFANLERAPEGLRARIAAIPGVQHVDTRVTIYATIDLVDFAEPVTGIVTSVPDVGAPLLGEIYLHSGRHVEAGRTDEVVVSHAFAHAQKLQLGDTLSVILRGKRKDLVIVGTGVSPEYIHQLRPGGLFPDYERFGVLWMARTALAAASDMEGAFNDVALTVSAGADTGAVIEQLDALLARYGGRGALERADQSSHRFLAQEFQTLESLVGVFPLIFMAVAAFLLNVVVSRLVGTQREQIGTLKAFGYSNRAVGLHYLGLVMLIVAGGTAVGVSGGAVLGFWFSNIYKGLFELPYLHFRVAPLYVTSALLISAAAALLGTVFAVRRAARIRPAEAMHAETPVSYRSVLIERLGLQGLMGQPTRMILRHLSHRPLKSTFSVLGIAFAVGILMTGRFQGDSVTHSMYLQFGLGQREDLSLLFVEPTSRRALYDLLALPGVSYGEGYRWVPVRLHSEYRSFRTGVMGLEPDGRLRRLIDEQSLRPVPLPPAGIVINDYLADRLKVRTGERLWVEVLEGRRTVHELTVARVVPKLLGAFTYMDLTALNRLMLEGDTISGAALVFDRAQSDKLYATLKQTPRITGVALRENELANFHETMDETMLFFTFIATVFSAIIALGVVYNSARITLTERSRELASLRVLGFTRGEISYVLLGELGLITLAAIPLGLAIGYALCWYIARAIDNELYRVPLIIEPDTYAFAVSVVLAAVALSALLVRRRLDHLDLIAVLKTRE